ncbi:hypothetical protein BTO04_13555 [Polaribacter sp. SA4-10]|uniref:nucleotidyltransferase domain-containing protein n=1 Tax=Polaribacter sp. SA4-10 TaxID=754397 RepID=UPI000B3BFE7E|nr:nucleotidyltransferase family protein [Polaribacter sp. SA4-10]ARV07653.1 hypothetical protein BTO04_13555 [Polaribacter sp. SA4-10]
MNYKEILFFIAKCLTISLEEKNKKEIEHLLKTTEIDWDNLVKVSTAHYVFPALYCNLKHANFLHYLPEELVNYMIHITDLNRERNQQIITQAKEINELLLSNNITPIFLKGTGNLLEGLYADIAERMVGDIDFIFSKKDYPRAIEILTSNSYSKVSKDSYEFPQFKHYSRLQKENRIAAVEIHKELLIEKYADEFNYEFVVKDAQKINDIHFLSFENQLCLSIISNQINDHGMQYKKIALRNAYDVFLLSQKTDTKKAVKRFEKLFNPLNNFLSICYIAFGEIESIGFEQNDESKKQIQAFERSITDLKFANNHSKKTNLIIFSKSRLNIIYKSIFNKDHRTWLFKRTTDKNWQREKLVQLGLKKTKPNP